jgi:hypothetical protein
VPQLATLVLNHNKNPNIKPVKLKGIAVCFSSSTIILGFFQRCRFCLLKVHVIVAFINYKRSSMTTFKMNVTNEKVKGPQGEIKFHFYSCYWAISIEHGF